MGTTKQIPRTSRVEVEVAAPVDAVWQVLADVTRTGEWSHECQRVDLARRRYLGVVRRPLPRRQQVAGVPLEPDQRDHRARARPRHRLAHRPELAVPGQHRVAVHSRGLHRRHPDHADLRGRPGCGVVGVVDGADGAAAPRPERRPRCRPAPDRGGRAARVSSEAVGRARERCGQCGRTRTLRQVTQPSRFSNSETSTATTSRPRSRNIAAVRGAAELIRTVCSSSTTTWEPGSSGTAR